MGVKGLWDLIRPAGVRTNLQTLAREALSSGAPCFRVGIDASLWIFHSRDVKGGENPSLRTVFFRIISLLQHPVTPIFVFDGPQRPTFKRGNRTGGNWGTNDPDSRNFQRLLDLWRIPWLQAPGEAEAELAALNRAGKLDAVLSDDADAFVFGARVVLRNNSPELSGSKAAGVVKSSKEAHLREYEIYRIESIVEHMMSEDSALKTEEDCRLAMVLVALLSGGDYCPQGIARIGPKIAMGLAHAGHIKPLAKYTTDPDKFTQRLPNWQTELVEELRHDLSGHIGRKNKVLASNLEAIDSDELLSQLPLKEYLQPTITSPSDQGQKWARLDTPDLGRGTLSGVAKACEDFFEWGTPDLVVKKFSAKHSVFSAHVVTSALNYKDVEESAIVRVHDVKPSKLDMGHRDVVLDCRWSAYADLCRASMSGSRPDPSTLAPEVRLEMGLVEVARQPAAQPAAGNTRIKIPEYLVRRAWQTALDDYEKEKSRKAEAKAKKPKAKPKAAAKSKSTSGNMDIMSFMTQLPATQVPKSQLPVKTAPPKVQPLFTSPPPSPPLSEQEDAAPPPKSPSGQGPVAEDEEYDSSVVLLAPPVSPSKRGRGDVARSTSSASRSGSPTPKRGSAAKSRKAAAARSTSAEVPGPGTANDPISLSDSSDGDDVLPVLRTKRGTSVSRSRTTPASTKTTPRTRTLGRTRSIIAAVEGSPAKEDGKAAKPKSAQEANEQTLLSGFFKTQAKAAKAAKPKKVEKEKYKVIEKDGVEEYHFL